MNSWEEDIQKKAQKNKCLTVTVIGRTGVGKTSLMNGLLGKEVGKERCTLSSGTLLMLKSSEIQGVWATIWDIPWFWSKYSCKDEEWLVT